MIHIYLLHPSCDWVLDFYPGIRLSFRPGPAPQWRGTLHKLDIMDNILPPSIHLPFQVVKAQLRYNSQHLLRDESPIKSLNMCIEIAGGQGDNQKQCGVRWDGGSMDGGWWMVDGNMETLLLNKVIICCPSLAGVWRVSGPIIISQVTQTETKRWNKTLCGALKESRWAGWVRAKLCQGCAAVCTIRNYVRRLSDV